MPKGQITTPETVKGIQESIKQGQSNTEIADRFGVHKMTVCRIRNQMPCEEGERNTLTKNDLKEWDAFMSKVHGVMPIPNTLWKYETQGGEYYGVVVAKTKKIAEKRVRDMYQEWGDSVNVIVTPAKGDCIKQDPFPDVVEIYAE